MFRIGDARLKPAVIGKQQQSLAVVVEPAGRVDAGHSQVVGERGTAVLVRELGEHTEGFIEEQQAGHVAVSVARGGAASESGRI